MKLGTLTGKQTKAWLIGRVSVDGSARRVAEEGERGAMGRAEGAERQDPGCCVGGPMV